MSKKIRVLVVDDSAMVREILSKGLELDPDIEVVGSAADPYFARDKILELRPDVLTLDVEMPKMDGVEFLRRLMPQYPLPIVMVSSFTERGKEITVQALEAGAIDFVTKPSTDIVRGLNGMLDDLRSKIKIASRANVSSWKKKQYKPARTLSSIHNSPAESADKVITIGASTGGTEAIRQVLNAACFRCSRRSHRPTHAGGFTSMFAKSLNEQCAVAVKEAEPEERVRRGRF